MHGASMMLASAVMCGKRLKCWNTMPISARFLATSLSRQLVQLVALLAVPDELAVDEEPTRVDLLEMVDAAQEACSCQSPTGRVGRRPAPAATWKSMPLSTSLAPNDLCTCCASTIKAVIG